MVLWVMLKLLEVRRSECNSSCRVIYWDDFPLLLWCWLCDCLLLEASMSSVTAAAEVRVKVTEDISRSPSAASVERDSVDLLVRLVGVEPPDIWSRLLVLAALELSGEEGRDLFP